MSYLYFDKDHLVNLHFSLTDEFIETNRVGCYSSSSIVLCNTRKYHGLLIAPVDQFKGERHVLLSAMDETIIQHGQEFHLGTHQYPNDVIEPDGAKYLWEFTFEENPKWLIRVGGVLLEKEIFLSLEEARLFVRYTLVEAHSQTRLQLKPYLAFRNIHSLTKGNMDVNTRSMKCKNGISVKLYNGFPRLYMQLSRKNEFVSSPDWYYNIEYTREFERGYESNEDLFVPGFFEAELKKGETLTFTAGLSELAVQNISRKANHEKNKKNDRQDMVSTLKASAENFITSLNNQQAVIAGFYWFAQWGRDSLIALAELTLNQGRTSDFFAVIDDLAAQMKNGLMPNAVFNKKVTYNAIDTPFWFIWAIQQYVIRNENQKKWIWENYGNVIETIFKHFMNGTDFNIHIKENGLVYGGEKGVALTWMDAMIDDQPVTPRAGAPVEVNALWYNAIVFALDLAGKSDDKKFISKYERWPEIVSESFIDCFWDEEKGYLADFIQGDDKCMDVRPNQILAVALPYSPVDGFKKKSIVDIVHSELLTSKGIRSLSPKNENYKDVYSGDQQTRDEAYHQGTVWPWMLRFFAEAYFFIYKHAGIHEMERIFHGFEEDMKRQGLGFINEIYDGNPPYDPKGAIAQAWSTSAVLRLKELIDQYTLDSRRDIEAGD